MSSAKAAAVHPLPLNDALRTDCIAVGTLSIDTSTESSAEVVVAAATEIFTGAVAVLPAETATLPRYDAEPVPDDVMPDT